MTDPYKRERIYRHAVQVGEAQKRLGAFVSPTDREWVPLEQAYGRYLAEDIPASHPLPHFRRSGMDGFAVRTADLREASADRPVCLKVIEHVPCGFVPGKRLEPGTAARTMTGAMVPEGADAVVRLEAVQEEIRDGEPHIRISRRIPPGDNVSEIGSELPEGALILRRGRRIRSGELAVLAAYGCHRVPVFRAPVVAIFSTGAELLRVEEPLQPGKIRNSNAHMLAGLVRQAGGVPLWLGQIGDDLDAARAKMAEGLDRADLVISTGGVSVGDHDVLTDLFLRWEGETLFNKVAMRPGSPTTAGVLDGKICLALSGNPGACFVGFHLFARPVLLGMQGCGDPYLPEIKAVLQGRNAKADAYTRFVRGRLLYTDDGRVGAEPVGQDKSSVMTSIKDADCLIRIPPGKTETAEGSLVTALHLPEA